MTGLLHPCTEYTEHEHPSKCRHELLLTWPHWTSCMPPRLEFARCCDSGSVGCFSQQLSFSVYVPDSFSVDLCPESLFYMCMIGSVTAMLITEGQCWLWGKSWNDTTLSDGNHLMGWPTSTGCALCVSFDRGRTVWLLWPPQCSILHSHIYAQVNITWQRAVCILRTHDVLFDIIL